MPTRSRAWDQHDARERCCFLPLFQCINKSRVRLSHVFERHVNRLLATARMGDITERGIPMRSIFTLAAAGYVAIAAIALGEDQGLVKVIFDKKTGALIGAHMVGAEVTELIQGYVVAMNLETTEEELMHTIFPHPTISEAMKEAVLDAYGRVLNM